MRQPLQRMDAFHAARRQQKLLRLQGPPPGAVDRKADQEIFLMDHPKAGPKYRIYRSPNGTGWLIATPRGGTVPSELAGLFLELRLATLAVHMYEFRTSKRYASNTEQHVI